MKLSRAKIKKMIREGLGDKSQRFREPGPNNVGSVRLPQPVSPAGSDDEDLTDFYHDLLQMYIRSGNFEDAEKLKAKMGLLPSQGVQQLEESMPFSSKGSDLNKEVAVEMLKSVITDLQNVPTQNFDKYIQYLINFQLPNIIRTLES